jgi:hypothetical protein
MKYEDRWEKIEIDGKDSLGSGGQECKLPKKVDKL